MKKRKVLFLLSIDTEEEFNWDGDFPQKNCGVENIQHIPQFQAFCFSKGIRPSYLVDYPVASNSESANILKKIALSGQAEIGAHLHPWCTPPFSGNNTERESHVVNLSSTQVDEKMTYLLQTINEQIGVSPKVFRTGRWGINGSALQIAAKAGLNVDSSIYPFYENEYFSCKQAQYTPYWPSFNDPDIHGKQRDIFEIPVTAGFNRPNFSFWSKVHNLLAFKAFRVFRLVGVAWNTNLLRKLYFSPELTSTKDLISLADAVLEEGQDVIHMYLHSSTLLPGKNIFTQTQKDVDAIYHRINTVIDHLKTKTELEFMTISEAKDAINTGLS